MKNVFRMFFVMCCVLMFNQIGFASDRIGVVDIQSIVNRSNAVRLLKQEHARQIESLNNIINEAQNAIAKETDPQKIVMLQDKYNSEFNTRKEAINNAYQNQLSKIESNLKNDIIESAKRNNYDFVIAKSVVFHGGEDITELIARDVK